MSTTQTFTCIFCKDSFNDKETYQIHFRQHGDPNLHNLITAKKQSQDEARKSDANMKQKYETTEMVSCDVCTETFLTISKAITHKHKAHPEHDAKYFCPWCGKLFTMKHLYNKHLTSHSAGNKSEENFHCDYCRVDFHNAGAVLYHNKFFHREDSDMPIIGSSKKRKLVNNKLMVLHYCCFCGDEYVNRVNLRKHMTDDHSDENQCPDEVYRCPLCEAIFYHLDAYEVHLTFHSNNDNYGSTVEVITSDFAEFNLETVPPKIEKVENYEDDPENNITSIGIDQFLQLAIDTPNSTKVENEDEQGKSHKKHKKHKKSKKAITLDQFLNMNKDVFGDCLDIQGVEEVPTQVVTKQFRVKKPKTQPISKSAVKVISAANLDKLKQQGIVVKMKSSNKGVPVLPGMQMLRTGTTIKNPVKIGNSIVATKNDNSNTDNTTKAVLSKIINKPNSEIHIVKKPITENIDNETEADLNTDSKNDLQDHDETHDSGRESDNETEQCKQVNAGEDNVDKEKVKTNNRQESPNNEINDQLIPSPNNSSLQSQEPIKAFQKLGQEITIKPINKNTDCNKIVEKPKEERVIHKLVETKNEIIHIDHDEEDDEFGDSVENTNDVNSCIDKDPNNSKTDNPENLEKNMLVRLNKNQGHSYNSSEEEDNTDSEFNNFSNANHVAALDKIKKLNQSISIKSSNESKNLTIKSSDSFRNFNVVQCVKTMKVENYSSNFKQLLKPSNLVNKINHLHNQPKPKTADSLKVINSFKEINFTDDDDDDEELLQNDIEDKFHTNEETEIKETFAVKKNKEENIFKPLNQTITVKKGIPLQKESVNFESTEEYSDNSSNCSYEEYEDHSNELPSDNNVKEKNKNFIEKLKNTNTYIKSLNERPHVKVLNKPQQKITASPMITSKISYQNKALKCTYDSKETEEREDDFSNEEMQFFENETSDEELHETFNVQNPHHATVNKLLSSNQSLSIKTMSPNNPNCKVTSIKHSNSKNDEQEKSTAFINNLKTVNKNLIIKSVTETKPSTSQDIKYNQKGPKIVSDPPGAQNNRDSSPKPSKPIPVASKVTNAKQQIRNTSSDHINKSNQIVHSKQSNQEVAATSQGQTVKQEVTVKTVQTKTETVVEEVTTTVTKTIRTINQTQTVNQEMSSVTSGAQIKSSNEGKSVIGKNVQRVQHEVRSPIKPMKNVIPEPKPKVLPHPRMIKSSVTNPVKVSNQMVALSPNTNQHRPRNPCIPFAKKIMPGPSSQQQSKASTSKPLKISPNVIKQQPRIVNKNPAPDSSGPFSSFKKQKELVPNIDDLISEQDGYDVTLASHVSNSQQSTSKIMKAGSLMVSTHKSQVNSSLSQQLTRLSNNSSLKIVKTNIKTANEIERGEASTTKRTALDAIQKLQKQGLLVKKPKMDFDIDDMSGSGWESDDHEHNYLAEASDE